MTNPFRSFSIVGGLAAAALLGLAPTAGAEDAAEPGPAGAVAPTLHGELALSLQDAITMAVENNLDVEIERHGPLIAEAEHSGAWGAYDPELFAEGSYTSNDRPTSNPLESAGAPGGPRPVNLLVIKDRSVAGAGGVRGLVPRLGASWEIRYEASSAESDSSFPNLTPEYRARAQASGSLPLLRGLVWNEPWVAVRVSGIGRETADEEFRRVLMDTARDVEVSYWTLVAALDERRVAEKSLEAARALREQTGAQYEAGVVSRVDVVESDAGVAERESVSIRVENLYLSAQDLLIDRVLGPHLTAGSTLRVRPLTEPEVVSYEVDREAVAARAMTNRPELEAARRQVEQARVQHQFAKNQRLPQLDLVASYGFTGLAGKPNTRAFLGSSRTQGDIPREFSGADDQFFDGDGATEWSAGAVFSIPIGNVRARSEARIAALNLRRAGTQLRRVEQQIVLEVRDAVRQMRLTREAIEAARKRREAAAEQVRAENIRLEYGESTPFDVLLRDRDLVEAESQEILALRNFRTAIAAVDRAQGTILRDRNILVEDARALR